LACGESTTAGAGRSAHDTTGVTIVNSID
jgi:hypothetical protein